MAATPAAIDALWKMAQAPAALYAAAAIVKLFSPTSRSKGSGRVERQHYACRFHNTLEMLLLLLLLLQLYAASQIGK